MKVSFYASFVPPNVFSPDGSRISYACGREEYHSLAAIRRRIVEWVPEIFFRYVDFRYTIHLDENGEVQSRYAKIAWLTRETISVKVFADVLACCASVVKNPEEEMNRTQNEWRKLFRDIVESCG